LRGIMEMMPGFNKMMDMEGVDEALEGDPLKPIESMILSMTPDERRHPDILNGSRKKRIAKGSGRTPQELNQLLDMFGELRTMMRQMNSGKGQMAKLARQYAKGGGMPGMPGLAGIPGMPEGGMPALPGPVGGGKKSGKAARKAKRAMKAKSQKRR